MVEEFHKADHNTGIDDGLDLVVVSVRKVRDCPAGVDQYLLVGRVDELRQGGQGRRDQIPVGLRLLSSTEVAQGPSSIPKHAEFVLLVEHSEEWLEGTGLNDVVATGRTISGDVSQCPNSLLADVEDGR